MNNVTKSIVEKLQLDQAKLSERFANERVVYAYRSKGSDTITDNLLLLPRDVQPAHRTFLFERFSSIPLDHLEVFKDVSVYRIGYFNVSTLSFKRCSERHMFDIKDVIESLRKVSKK